MASRQILDPSKILTVTPLLLTTTSLTLGTATHVLLSNVLHTRGLSGATLALFSSFTDAILPICTGLQLGTLAATGYLLKFYPAELNVLGGKKAFVVGAVAAAAGVAMMPFLGALEFFAGDGAAQEKDGDSAVVHGLKVWRRVDLVRLVGMETVAWVACGWGCLACIR
jgi:hypothetical protein